MSGSRNLDIEIDGKILSIVPAIHYRVAFAEAVNEIACRAEGRPDAIAVEMGPGLASAVVAWLREIGLGPDRRVRMPCLLGFKARARYLSPSVREAAAELQVEWGRELADIPSDVLERELDHRTYQVTPLSPTDSIVEATRCGVELGVPVVGVDLEEFARVARPRTIVPDTTEATGRVPAYSDEVASLIAVEEVPEVDERRELAMAARLKGLLQTHDRVLFSCGLGHWRRILDLLRDPSVAPAPIPPEASEASALYSRQVIHPGLAFQFLDRAPLTAWLYERRRRHPLLQSRGASRPVEVTEVFDAKIRQSVRDYLEGGAGNPSQAARGPASVRLLADFPSLVRTHAALSLAEVPGVAAAVRCAEAFMGRDFAAVLSRNMIRFPWARPGDFPETPLLLPPTRKPSAKAVQVVREGPAVARGVEQVECVYLPEDSGLGSWDDLFGSRAFPRTYSHTWRPWEHLTTGLSDDAIEVSMRSEGPPVVEPFRGSLERGIAPRETLRARARGERGVYVYGRRCSEEHGSVDLTDGWPVVWIFDSGVPEGASWTHLVVPVSWMMGLARDQGAFRQRYGKYDAMGAIIGFGRHQSGLDWSVSRFRLSGLLLFLPVFDDTLQYARWAEVTGGARNSWTGGGARPLSLPNGQATVKDHRSTDDLAWQSHLIRTALPFAGTRVTVVLPSGFEIHPSVEREAARLGKLLARVDLERFDAADVERIRTKQGVPGFANGRTTAYPVEVAETIGESIDRYADRMPAKWRRFAQ